MPKVDLSAIEQTTTTGYPPPYDRDVAGRHYRRVGAAMGLKRLGISECTLEPGAWSSQRHWHEGIDEIVVMIAGEAMLVEEGGETLLRAGDVATFGADVANGHHLINRSERPCTFVAIDNAEGEGNCHYPDADLIWNKGEDRYTRRDGTPY
ncbi:MAG: cupin domain-containing protein [Pseudomonadota bacterium]